jgi:hypothetical protein
VPDHGHAREPLLDDPGRSDAIELGHAHVHDDRIGLQRDRELDRLLSVVRLTHDIDVWEELEKVSQRRPDQPVVIDHKEAKAIGHVGPSALRRNS